MPRYLPIVESLEIRDTPAGTVTGSLVDGTWTLVGDAEANDILIKPGSLGDFTVSGRNGTSLAGITDATHVNHIVIKLGQGDDYVEINEDDDPTVVGSLTIFGGHGNNTAYIRTLQVYGDVSIRNGRGDDTLFLANSVVMGNVVVENGRGGSDTEIYRSDAEDSSFIGGSLIIRNDRGEDYTEVVDTHVGGNVSIVNGLPDASGMAGDVYIYNDAVTTGRSIIGGNVSVSYTGGKLDGYDGIWDTEVLGNVKFDLGAGEGLVRFDGYTVNQPVHVHGNLTVLGQGAASVDIGVHQMQSGLIVDGNLVIQAGAGASMIQAFQLHVGGATRISTGGGADQVYIDDSNFAGRVLIDTGAGTDSVQIESLQLTTHGTSFQSNLKVALGAGKDTLRFGINQDDTGLVELLAKSLLDGGAGQDRLVWNNLDAAFSYPDIQYFEILPV